MVVLSLAAFTSADDVSLSWIEQTIDPGFFSIVQAVILIFVHVSRWLQRLKPARERKYQKNAQSGAKLGFAREVTAYPISVYICSLCVLRFNAAPIHLGFTFKLIFCE